MYSDPNLNFYTVFQTEKVQNFVPDPNLLLMPHTLIHLMMHQNQLARIWKFFIAGGPSGKLHHPTSESLQVHAILVVFQILNCNDE